MDSTKSDCPTVTTTISYGPVKNNKELKQKGFEYGDDICKWVNSQNNIEVVSIVPDNRGFTNSNFILFYYEKRL